MNKPINNIPGGWTFNATINADKNLVITAMNRTNTSVVINLQLNNPTEDNLKDMSVLFSSMIPELYKK